MNKNYKIAMIEMRLAWEEPRSLRTFMKCFFFLKKTRIPVAPKEYKILIERHGSHYTPWKCKSTAPAHLARYCPKTPHREKERVKRVTINRLICPHVMIFDWWWFMKFYLLSLPVLSYQKWHLYILSLWLRHPWKN
jgi:hypothetical protein